MNCSGCGGMCDRYERGWECRDCGDRYDPFGHLAAPDKKIGERRVPLRLFVIEHKGRDPGTSGRTYGGDTNAP
jgi:hypothetical protein